MATEAKKEKDKPDEDKPEEGAEGETPEAGPRKINRTKLMLLIGPPVLLILGGAGAFFGGFLDGVLGLSEPPPVEAEATPGEATFINLPEMLVNLNGTGNRRGSYLRVVVSLELSRKEDADRVNQVMPRVIDNFQVFLRELRVEDLRGSAGMYRLKEELLQRVNESAKPAEVKDVLFKEMLVQ